MQPSPVLLASRIYEQGVLLTRIIARQRYKLDFYKLLASATPDPAAAFTCLSPLGGGWGGRVTTRPRPCSSSPSLPEGGVGGRVCRSCMGFPPSFQERQDTRGVGLGYV